MKTYSTHFQVNSLDLETMYFGQLPLSNRRKITLEILGLQYFILCEESSYLVFFSLSRVLFPGKIQF